MLARGNRARRRADRGLVPLRAGDGRDRRRSLGIVRRSTQRSCPTSPSRRRSCGCHRCGRALTSHRSAATSSARARSSPPSPKRQQHAASSTTCAAPGRSRGSSSCRSAMRAAVRRRARGRTSDRRADVGTRRRACWPSSSTRSRHSPRAAKPRKATTVLRTVREPGRRRARRRGSAPLTAAGERRRVRRGRETSSRRSRALEAAVGREDGHPAPARARPDAPRARPRAASGAAPSRGRGDARRGDRALRGARRAAMGGARARGALHGSAAARRRATTSPRPRSGSRTSSPRG